MLELEFWPFREDDGEYGPITAETTPVVVAETVEAGVEKLPAPPTGCYWGLVAMTGVAA